jgi:hypothetical protein
MILKPGGKGSGPRRGEQVKRTMRGKLDQGRLLILAVAIGPVVHAEGMWRWPLGQSGTPRQPHQRIRAGGHSLAPSDPRAQFAADIQSQVALLVRQARGSPGRAGDDRGQRRGTGEARTGGVATQEAPQLELKLHGQTGPGQIGHGALGVAVAMGRFGLAGRTARSALGRTQIEDDSLGRGRERGKPEPRGPG